jgi:hypothetical protein
MTAAKQTQQSAKTLWAALSSWLKPAVYRALLFRMLGEEIRRTEQRAKLLPAKRKKELDGVARKMRAAHAAMSGDLGC